MIHTYADPATELVAREAAVEEQRAALLSRADGRAVDGFGVSRHFGGSTSGAGRRCAGNHEARKRRLQIARWWARARREWEAEVAECRRRACEEFAVLLSADEPAEGAARLSVRAVNMRPVSERGEAKNGVEVAFEVETDGNTVARQPRDRGMDRFFTETFGWPSPSHHDGGAFAGQRLTRLGLATRVIGPEASGRVVPVSWQEMVGRRLAAAVRRQTFAGDEGEIVSARIDGLKMWAAGCW